MNKLANDMVKKNFWLVALGVALQMFSGLCFLAAAIGTMKEAAGYIRRVLAAAEEME